MTDGDNLTRRERQVMTVVLEAKKATAKEIRSRLVDPPSYSAVRAVLSRLVAQGFLKYREDGPRYVYMPAENLRQARRAALKKIMDTFFDGSPLHTMNALLGISASELSREELEDLATRIAQAAEETDG